MEEDPEAWRVVCSSGGESDDGTEILVCGTRRYEPGAGFQAFWCKCVVLFGTTLEFSAGVNRLGLFSFPEETISDSQSSWTPRCVL